jgi:RING finger protein 121/175
MSNQDISQMKAIFLLFLVFGLIICLQALLQAWKKHYTKSYNYVTLFLMWIFIFIISYSGSFYRMLFFWFLFSLISVYLLKIAFEKKIHSTTPRRVYGIFYWIYKLTHAFTIIGFFLYILEVIRLLDYIPFINRIDHSSYLYFSPTTLMFYGLYFSILVRDCTEVCSDQMAYTFEQSRNEYYTSESRTDEKCGICNEEFEEEKSIEGEEEVPVSSLRKEKRVVIDKKRKIECGHYFHEFCIRGMVILIYNIRMGDNWKKRNVPVL